MINNAEHPVAWTLLICQVDDLCEHLDTLAKTMADNGAIDEEDFRVQVAHAYAHLNRIWNSRDDGSEDGRRLHEFSKFPTDIEPIG
jgi:hypothetical protein